MTHPILDNFPSVFPHCADLGLQVTQRGDSKIQIQLAPRPEFKAHASMDILHTSVITSAADTTAGLAAMASLPKVAPLATLDLHVDYLKPASSRNTVVIDAECFKRTQNVAFVRGVVWQQNTDNVVANITASFMLDTPGARAEA
jgi:uncharacterized protein (TIGR00369 family)